MAIIPSPSFVVIGIYLFLVYIPSCKSLTVIMSDTGVPPSALVDGPQTGFTMKNDGARTDSREQDAVYDIMRATGNDWATDIRDVCRGRWHGIECMPDKDNVYHVVSLSFGALSDDTAFPTCDAAKSFISPSITKLPRLRTLFFYQCLRSNPQPIPAFLGRLGASLQSLVLIDNGHIGRIPHEIGNLTRLKTLDLHGNNLNGSIPASLGRLAGLRSLDLSVNQITGPIPELVFPQLNILDLNKNDLQGPIPNSLMGCHSLIKMDISRNRLSGLLPESMNNLQNLILFDLSYNGLSGPFPASLKHLNTLQALILNGNPTISTTIPDGAFNGFKDLSILILSETNLQGQIPESFGQLRKLRVLHLDGNNLSGTIPTSLGELNSLSELRLNNNMLMGPVPFKREMIWRMKGKLRLYNNSGLCYDPESGLGLDLVTLSDSGIRQCHMMTKTEQTKVVEHVSVKSSADDRKSSPLDGLMAAFAPCLLSFWLVI